MQSLVATHNAERPVELREVAEPTAEANEAIVEVHAFSLNRGELSLLANRPEGWRPGQDISGIVIQKAADGSGPEKGTRVVGLVDGAGWSQRVAVQTTRLAALPDNVGFEAAASLPIAGLTALRTVRIGGSILGQRVLVTGASGGVGRFAVELAARSGAYVTGVVGSKERGEGLQELGASELVTLVDELQGDFELILESVGGDSLAAAVKHIAQGGTIVVFGNSSTQPTPVSFYDLAGHAGARIQSFVSYLSGPPESFAKDLALLARLVSEGKLHPSIGFEGNWRELGDHLKALAGRQVKGKMIFKVDGSGAA